MKFLLDSNFCIACLRRKPWAIAALAVVEPDSLGVSAITVGELVLGTHLAEFSGRELRKTQAFLDPLQVLPFGQAEAYQWAGIDALLRKGGNRIEAQDAMIAATALAHRLTVVTGNLKHFERVKGLKVVDWETRPPKA